MIVHNITQAEITESVRAQIAARKEAQERARQIIETTENLELVVKAEIGRRISECLQDVEDAIETTLAFIASKKRLRRTIIIRALVGLENKLSTLSAAYQSGALPK